MAVPLGMGIVIPAGISVYRITPVAYRTASARHHRKVVNGEGAVRSRNGARYNYPGVRTVYLAQDPLTCLVERMFYFHREVLTGLDNLHLMPALVTPSFLQPFVLWDVVFRNPVANVFDLTVATAPAAGVFPSLLLNPSQDYWHLKDRRAQPFRPQATAASAHPPRGLRSLGIWWCCSMTRAVMLRASRPIRSSSAW